jgi:7-cyano-7-deazaguanine tRNA-ribosyltransferase
VKESDLLGRIGVLTTGGKRVETPCLFPVIHPVRETVTVQEFESMGFVGLMTNALILYTRRRDDALREGIHKLLNFGGMFMTDSGGYQVLEYGSVDVDYRRIAAFQSRIRSDLAVTLDRPTGYSLSRKYAVETMEYSLKNALATIREFGGSATTWVGPVQGGLFSGLLQKSSKKLLAGGFRFLALGSPTQVMENYRFAELVKMITATRRAAPYSVPLHLFGAGHPLTMPLSIALGCDTFDSASYALFARQDRYMTARGVLRLEQMSRLPCSCPVCLKTSVRDLREMEHGPRSRQLALHNLFTLRAVMEACKEAIHEGRLWDLVEETAASHPRLLDAFHALADQSEMLEGGTPFLKDRGLFLRGAGDDFRPELRRAKKMLSGAVRRRSDVALLILGGEDLAAVKLKVPEGAIAAAGCDVYRVHGALGVYPAELEFVYPFTQSVLARIRGPTGAEATAMLRGMGYRRVVCAWADEKGRVSVGGVRNRRTRTAASPYPP